MLLLMFVTRASVSTLRLCMVMRFYNLSLVIYRNGHNIHFVVVKAYLIVGLVDVKAYMIIEYNN